MSPIVSTWLEQRGLVVYSEVPAPGSNSNIDLVGWNQDADKIVCVEMKLCLSRYVFCQAQRHWLITPQIYIAVASKPKAERVEFCKKTKLGLLRVTEQVQVLLEPTLGPYNHNYWRDKVIACLKVMTPGGIGGQPTLEGEGPAQLCYAAVQRYKKAHPKATWREIFSNVPNHYSSYRSMSGAMAGVELREYLKGCKQQPAERRE